MKKKVIISVAVVFVICAAFILQGVMEKHGKLADAVKKTISSETNKIPVVVHSVTPLAAPVRTETEWLPADFYDAFTDFDLVAVCRIVDSEEVCIEYTKEITRKEYGTRLTVQPEEILYQSAHSKEVDADSLSVWNEMSSRRMPEEGALIQKGEEYIFFLQSAEKTDSPLDYSAVCDYILRLPKTGAYLLKKGAGLSEEMAEFLNVQAGRAELSDYQEAKAGMTAEKAVNSLYEGKGK